jgi:1,4-dihydroxy-2-naphthoate octaprenyltransferase
MIAGIIFLLFYTWPLKYIGLGEITVVFVWGPLMIGGAYYVTSNGSWNWDIILLSLVYAIGPTSVIFGKHIDKLDKDQEKKVYTLPVLIGEKSRALYNAYCMDITICSHCIFHLQGNLSIYLAIIFLALSKICENL